MTTIQASVAVQDKVDSKIEQKILNIGTASEKTTNKLNKLNRAIKGLSSTNIVSFNSAISNLKRINLSNVNAQLKQLTTLSQSVGKKFTTQAIASVKLQVVQTKLAQEQTKLAILQEKLKRTSSDTAISQQRLAIVTNNLANAQDRATRSSIQAETAMIRQNIANVRLGITQQRLATLTRKKHIATNEYNDGLLRLLGTFTLLSSVGGSAFGLIKVGDEYQRLSNKLGLVTENAEQAKNRLATLNKVALSSYSGMDSTVQLYTRLDLALRQMGGTASEAIAITATLSKAVSLAGLTTAEANSALLQISQAFNKGKLDGDEFRTVMETMPPLADALAKKLNTTRGELLKLAPEGKITGQVMKEAVLEMAESIDQKFAKLTPTISMQLQNLKTQVQMYFGAMFQNTGLAEKMSNAIGAIGNNLDRAVQWATYFGIAISVAMARSAVLSMASAVTTVTTAFKGATGAVTAFSAAFRATPVGLLVTGVTLLISTFDQLFNGVISKSLFPNFDQDQARVDDYINRIKEINVELNTMSSIRLANNLTDNLQVFDKANADIKKYQNELDLIETKLQRNVYLEQLKGELLKKQSESVLFYAFYADEIDTVSNSITDNNKLLQDRDKTLEKLQDAEQNRIELLKQQLGIYTQLQDRLDSATRALDRNKIENNLNSEQQLTYEKTIKTITSRFGDLKVKIEETTKALKALGVVDLSPTLDESLSNLGDKFDTTALAKIRQLQEQREALHKVKTTSGSDNDLAKAELSLLNYKEQFSTVDMNGKVLTDLDKANGVKSAYQELLAITQKQNQVERENAEQKQEQEKKARELESLERRKQQQITRNKEEYERFVGKLDDENLLLSQGLDKYNNYNQLYSLRLKLQQNGLEISEQELEVLKQKIDQNVKAKELAKGIADEEQRSLEKQREQFELKLQAIQLANTTPVDKTISFDKLMSDGGLTYSTDQGVTQLLEQQEFYYQRLAELREQNKLSEEEYETARLALSNQTDEAIYQKRLSNMQQIGGMQSVMATAIKSFETNATNSIVNVLNGTQSISDAMRGLATTILNEVIRAIVQMGVRWAIMQATQTASAIASNTAMASSAAATGASITASMTPAATVSSMATFGGSATAGMTAMLAGVAMIPAILAMALAGKRKDGGTVNAGDLYQVGEGNAPEIFQSRSGRQYMIAGDNGRVFSNKQVMAGSSGGKVVHVTQNVTINGNGKLDPDTLKQLEEQTRSVVYDVITTEKRDSGGMLA